MPLTNWQKYLKYLVQWAKEHQDVKYEGMSPVCYDEYCDNELDPDLCVACGKAYAVDGHLCPTCKRSL